MLQIKSEEKVPSIAFTETRESDPASLVATRFRRSGHPFLWSIRCKVRDGVAELTGTIPTFHLKQMAQELAFHTPGVRQVNNLLRVTASTYPAGRSKAAE